MRKQVFASVVALVVVTLASSQPAWSAPTAEQKAEIEAVGELMKQAGDLFKAKDYEACGEVVRQVQTKVASLSDSGDAVILRQLDPIFKRLKQGHATLELQGVELEPLAPLGAVKPKAKPTPEKPKEEPKPTANGLSFVKHVAPVLITKCGRCHIAKAEDGFSAASYASLMKGSNAGKVIFPGDASGSRVMELIASGDMPRGGKLTQLEVDVLTKWINDGAKFDGDDEKADITRLSTAPKPTTPETPMIVEATGKETVSFSRDIASVLAQNCNGCHGTNQPRQNFSLTNFASLIKGGDSGSPISPGKGAESLIVMKLKGTAGGARMPMGRDPLADTVVAKIEKWIDEGATFDGPDANAPLAQIAAIAKAAGATHQELTAERIELAEGTWNTAMPQVKSDSTESATFYARGTVGENTLKDIVEKAEAYAPQIAEIVHAPSDKPLIKGRLTVLVVNQRYDFSEIAKVLLNTTNVPPRATGLWRYNGIDASGVVMLPKSEADYAVEMILVEQATAAHLSGSGKNVPRWFAEGVGRVVAARIMPADKRIQAAEAIVPAAFAMLSSPAVFMDAKFDPEIAPLASYSYARYLMNDTKRFAKLMEGLHRGGKFDEAFTAAYGSPANVIAEVWYRKGPGKPPRAAKTPPAKTPPAKSSASKSE